MKKSHLTLTAFALCTLYGVLSWDLITHSATPDPATSQYASMCSTTQTAASGAPVTDINECCIDYHESLDAVKRDWQASLQQLINQEVATSEMVDDGYESLRTYNCWVEYICLAVQYSGHAPIESALGTGLTSEHLGVVPGCQKPENLRMETEYNHYNTGLEGLAIVGLSIDVAENIAEDIADGVADTFGDFITENKINFFPRCMTDPTNDNRNPELTLAKSQYDDCKRALEINFGCPAGIDKVLCDDTSTAFVTLENALKTRSADQKAAALEKKLSTIVPKLQGMETHVGYLSNFLEQLDARFSCYAGKCS